jgi:hypothetical protein
MLLAKAGEDAAVDLVPGGGDDAVGDRAQGGGPVTILQRGTFADDRAWAELATVNPDAEHTVEKQVDVVAGSPCSVCSAPLAILPIASLLPPRMVMADNCPSRALSATVTSGFESSCPRAVGAERGALPFAPASRRWDRPARAVRLSAGRAVELAARAALRATLKT